MENNTKPYINTNPERNYEREEAYLRAEKRVKKIVGFYWHLASYVVINIFILYLNSQNLNGDPFWSFNVFSTVFYWGIGIFFHFIGVFGSNLMFGKAWKQRKIEKYMEEDNKRWE